MRSVATVVALLVSASCSEHAIGEGIRYSYPYGYYHRYDGYDVRRDVKRLRTQIRSQQRQLKEQADLQQEQSRIMRQQDALQRQVTQRQACYYRYDAGIDLCEDLFEPYSTELAACRNKVAQKNPGCAADILRAETEGQGTE